MLTNKPDTAAAPWERYVPALLNIDGWGMLIDGVVCPVVVSDANLEASIVKIGS